MMTGASHNAGGGGDLPPPTLESLRELGGDDLVLAFETAVRGVWVIDADATIEHVNVATAEMLGYEPAEMVGRPLSAFMDASAWSDAEHHLVHLAGGLAEFQDLRLKHRNGRDVWALTNSAPVTTHDGRYAGAIAVVTDITDRKLAEIASATARSNAARGETPTEVPGDVDRYRIEDELALQSAVAANLAEGAWLVRTEDATIVWANHRMEELLGYGPGELVGKPIEQLNADVGTDPAVVASEIISELDRTGRWQGEIANRHRDGRIVWCHASVSTFEHPYYGRVWVSVHDDISDRKALEADLAEFFDLSLDMLVIAGFDGYFTEVNESAWNSVLGWTAAELEAAPFSSFVHPEDRGATLAAFEALRAGKDVRQFENRYRTADGDYRWLQWTARPVQHRRVVIAVARDITAEKLTAERDRILDELSQVVVGSETDFRTLTRTITRRVAEVVGDTCILSLVSGDASMLEPVAYHHTDPEAVEVLRELFASGPVEVGGPTTAGRVAATGTAAVENDIDQDAYRERSRGRFLRWLDRFGVHALAIVPLTSRGKTIGTLGASRDSPDRPYTPDDVQLLESIAARVSPALENAQLYRHLAEDGEIIASTEAGIAKLATDGTVLSWNPGAARISGRSAADMIGRNIDLMTEPSSETGHTERMVEMMRTDAAVHYEAEGRRPDGTHFWAAISLAPIHGEQSEIVAAAATFIDITIRRQAQAKLEVLARTDTLTGLANRREFERMLRRALAHTERYAEPGALLYLDLDGFKEVNDHYGHHSGDRLLTDVGRRLADTVRDADGIGRLGGDEFGIILERIDSRAAAVDVAERVLTALGRPFELFDHGIKLDASCGIAYFPDDGADPDTLLLNADTAMYSAKRRGGGHATRYRADLDVGVRTREQVITGLRRGIRTDEFRLHYQPIVNSVDGNVVGFEALARWQHPERGLLPPAAFLNLAEDSGLIIPLGNQLIDAASRQAAAWTNANGLVAPPRIAINLSRRQFAAAELAGRLASSLERYDLDPARIILEITETTLFDDITQAAHTLEQLREIGVQIALDDFGTGYSSLGALQELPVDALKIDRVFIERLDCEDPHECDSPQMALVTAAVNMGHTLGLTVIAEGVETRMQHECLRAAGCDCTQGFFFARPAPADDALAAARRLQQNPRH